MGLIEDFIIKIADDLWNGGDSKNKSQAVEQFFENEEKEWAEKSNHSYEQVNYVNRYEDKKLSRYSDNSVDQINRMNRAKYEDMKILSYDSNTQTAVIENSQHDSFYTVTPNSCTCPDFQRRGMKCKHIYKLLFELSPQQAPHIRYSTQQPKPTNGKMAIFLICLFGGVFGAHYFYAKRWMMGILYLFTCGLFGIGWIVDCFRILLGQFCDADGVIY